MTRHNHPAGREALAAATSPLPGCRPVTHTPPPPPRPAFLLSPGRSGEAAAYGGRLGGGAALAGCGRKAGGGPGEPGAGVRPNGRRPAEARGEGACPRRWWGGRRRLPAAPLVFLAVFLGVVVVVETWCFLVSRGRCVKLSHPGRRCAEGKLRGSAADFGGPCACFYYISPPKEDPWKPPHRFSLRVLKCCGRVLAFGWFLLLLLLLFFPPALEINTGMQTTSKINANAFVSLQL